MYLDAAEEKMLRAIVQSAVESAAAGRPFAGEFRHYRISAARLQVNAEGIAKVEARLVSGASIVVQNHQELVLAARANVAPSAISASIRTASSSGGIAAAGRCNP